MEWPTGPWNQVVWDMGRCHTWYVVGYGKGNVPERTGSPSDVYEGPNPPPNDAIRHCPPIWATTTRSCIRSRKVSITPGSTDST